MLYKTTALLTFNTLTLVLQRIQEAKYVKQIFYYLYQIDQDKVKHPISSIFNHYYYRYFAEQTKKTIFTYRVKLKLVGNGFYLKVESNQIFLYGGQSHLFSFSIPVGVEAVVKGRKKRILVIRCANKNQLINFAVYIQKFAYPDVYRHKGLRFWKQSLRRKEGKKKFV